MAGHGILFKFFNTLGSYRNALTSRIPAVAYQQQNVGLKMKTKDLLKNLQIPERPKRPLTPYFRFVNEHRPLIQKQHPDWKLVEITRQCAEDWKGVSTTIKDKYQEEYNKDLEVYNKKSLEFNSSLTDEQSEALTMAKNEKVNSKKKRLMKKLYRENEKPKRPLGSFLYFVKEKWGLPENKSKKLSEILSIVKNEWKDMPDAQKEKYIKLNDADRERYQTEMQVWEARMIKEGKSDIIRRDSQIISSKPSHLDEPKPVHTVKSKQKKIR